MLTGDNKSLKIGALTGVIFIALVIIAYFAWGEINRANNTRTTDIQVKPNMYDFREEARKGNLGKRLEVH
jgi:hypothetical protein